MTSTGAPGAKAALEWLAAVAPDPDACRWEWERNPDGVALLPAGRRWDVPILPRELGHPTLDVLTRLIDRPGPVLSDFGDARMGCFVPPPGGAARSGTSCRAHPVASDSRAAPDRCPSPRSAGQPRRASSMTTSTALPDLCAVRAAAPRPRTPPRPSPHGPTGSSRSPRSAVPDGRSNP